MFLSLSKFVFIRALVTAVCRCCFSNETNDIDKISQFEKEIFGSAKINDQTARRFSMTQGT